MKIILENAGKRYQQQWIFRNFSYQFGGSSYAITGRNGSGKSTLAALLSGHLLPTEGKVSHFKDVQKIDDSEIYRHLSFAAPYLELIEEFTVAEMVRFHFRLKQITSSFQPYDVLSYCWLEDASGKQVKHLSSGMKQRLKLGLAFLTNAPLLILDEPTSNLDKHGINWFLERLNEVIEERLVVVCSNQPYEYEMCKNIISMEDLK